MVWTQHTDTSLGMSQNLCHHESVLSQCSQFPLLLPQNHVFHCIGSINFTNCEIPLICSFNTDDAGPPTQAVLCINPTMLNPHIKTNKSWSSLLFQNAEQMGEMKTEEHYIIKCYTSTSCSILSWNNFWTQIWFTFMVKLLLATQKVTYLFPLPLY